MDLLMSNKLEMMWKETVMKLFEISRNLRGKAEENY
jgi:hypothetical protein